MVEWGAKSQGAIMVKKAATKKPAKKTPNYSKKTILLRKNSLTLAEYVELGREDIYRHNFDKWFHVDFDCDTYHACQHGSDCCDGDYCRCGSIINTRITDVSFYENRSIKKLKLVDQYYVDRIIRLSGVLKHENWDVDICGGYYGEETNGAILDYGVQGDFEKYLREGSALSDADKFKKLLEIEYGYVLDVLKPLNKIRLLERSPKSLLLFNDHYYGKIDPNLYKDHWLPVCVARKEGKKYVVIDGYHRLAAAMKNKTVKFFELYKE